MKKSLLAALLMFIATPFFITGSSTQKLSKSELLNKTELLNALQEVERFLQEDLAEVIHDYKKCIQKEHPEGFIFLSNLINEFYKKSKIKTILNNIDDAWFKLISSDPTAPDIGLPMCIADTVIDEDTETELISLFDQLYEKHHKIYCAKDPNGQFVTYDAEEFWFELRIEDVILMNFFNNRAPEDCLLTKVQAKITELKK